MNLLFWPLIHFSQYQEALPNQRSFSLHITNPHGPCLIHHLNDKWCLSPFLAFPIKGSSWSLDIITMTQWSMVSAKTSATNQQLLQFGTHLAKKPRRYCINTSWSLLTWIIGPTKKLIKWTMTTFHVIIFWRKWTRVTCYRNFWVPTYILGCSCITTYLRN
jgi:hypothetical protein